MNTIDIILNAINDKRSKNRGREIEIYFRVDTIQSLMADADIRNEYIEIEHKISKRRFAGYRFWIITQEDHPMFRVVAI